MKKDLSELNDRFGIPGLRISGGTGGLTRVEIDTPVAQGEVYLNGAHVTKFQPTGHAPVLWMSGSSYFQEGKPIRGGVPICFPWFGPNAQDPAAPAHGSARTSMWDLVGSGRLADGGVMVELATVIDGLSLRYRVEFGKSLELSLSVECHLGSQRLSLSPPAPLPEDGERGARGIKTRKAFEEALHTYFVVGDIRQVSIEGLEEYTYLNKVGGTSKREASGEAIRFTQETDRVYQDTNAVCTLRDPVLQRSITVHQRNSRSTVVWNPWIDKSARMPDFGDDEWPGMVCIETANVGDRAVEIQPGERHTLVARVEVSKVAQG